MASDDDTSEWRACKTHGELISAVNAVLGPDCAARLITEGGMSKYMLIDAADELRDVGLDQLARLCRKTARKAPLGVPDFIERQRLRKLGKYPPIGCGPDD